MNGRNSENRKNENRKNFGLRKSFFLPSAFKNGFLFNSFICINCNKILGGCFMRLLNTLTNQVLIFDEGSRSSYNFKKKCKALERIKKEYAKGGKMLQLYFLTITLDPKNIAVANKDLHRFITFMYSRFRRAKLPFYYLWVLELQHKRYKKFGVRAKHWHFAFLVPSGSLPDVVYFKKYPHYRIRKDGFCVSSKDIYKYWGLGQVLCQVAVRQEKVFGYLGKYLGKEIDYKQFALRSFGSSMFGYYAYPQWAFKCVEEIKSWGFYLSMKIKKVGGRLRIWGFDMRGDPVPVFEICSPYQLLSDYDLLLSGVS